MPELLKKSVMLIDERIFEKTMRFTILPVYMLHFQALFLVQKGRGAIPPKFVFECTVAPLPPLALPSMKLRIE